MAMQEYQPIPTGSTKVSLYLEMKDAATPFQPKTGLAFNSGGIVMSYTRKRAAAVTVTPVTLAAVSTAWTAGGVKEVDATNAVGLVRFDVPDAMFAPDGISDEVFFSVKATGYEPMTVRIPLIDPIRKLVTLLEATTRTNN